MISKKTTKEVWKTGSGKDIGFHEICNKILKNIDTNIKVFIGSDSDISNKQITFCKAICVYGSGIPAFYYFLKSKKHEKYFPNLFSRITEETRLSIELAQSLTENFEIPSSKIEIHLDVSAANKGTKTSKFSDIMRGYVQGAGYSCKIKPNGWAAQSVADRHSK